MAKIEFESANVVFPIVHDKGMTFKEFVIGLLGRKTKRKIDRIHALKDITLSLTDGARVGIIGHNGAGKSTLLRAIAGIYPIQDGRCEVVGKICSLFDITLGFEREASGWDNIQYRAFLQGETPASLKAKMDEISSFSELGDFLDVPLKCYSAGMITRLAFAVATANEPEILLIDEVFGTGDLGFRAKAKERMARMIDTARIIVMVGHDLASIESFCETVIWMDHGQIRQIGPAREVLTAYQQAAAAHPTVELVARHLGPGDQNMYVGRLVLMAGQTHAQILKNMRGRWQVLKSVPVLKDAGRLRFDVSGTNLKLSLDNQLLLELIDEDLREGEVGIRACLGGGSFERFTARGVTQDNEEAGFHPLSGPILKGTWRPIVGGFHQEGNRFHKATTPVAFMAHEGAFARDVSVACDVDLRCQQENVATSLRAA